MSTAENVVDLEQALRACSREPIHIPGRIQPHGVLLVMREPDLTVVQVSANTRTVLGRVPEDVVGRSLEAILGEAQTSRLRRILQAPELEAANPLAFIVPGGDAAERFDGIIHRTGQGLILELEPATRAGGVAFESFYHLVNASVQRLQGAPDMERLFQAAAEEVRQITGFDRVMVYRFDAEWNGEVLAEDREEHLEPFLGLRYPASDIPEQARKLYTVNRLRLIRDVSAPPSSLVPERHPDGAPLDLSFSVLRSVSPVHIEYLKNMGVGASMSVSLMQGERLWGLIACHHENARQVPYVRRVACDFLGQILSLQLAVRETERDFQERRRLEEIRSRLLAALTGVAELGESLTEHGEDLLRIVNATGAALCLGDEIRLVGHTPGERAIYGLLETLRERGDPEIYSTDSLVSLCPEAEEWRETASGLLSAHISQENRILWFRPEVVQVVHWAGQPEKAVRVEADRLTLHPRKSFEEWKQVVSLRSTPWAPVELEVASGFRSALVDLFLRSAEERARQDLERLNEELRASNEELDSFTYIVSHDLKEPLRGIQNYARFVLEDYAELLPEEGRSKLETLVELGRRTQDLIDNLLRFSRVGRTQMAFQQAPLDDVLGEVLALLGPRLEEERVAVRVPRPLPTLRVDRARVGEVFNNLITNAIKYTDKDERWVEIGWLDAEQVSTPVLYVRDNGIGIRERDYGAVFKMFHRLHTRHRYGGGSGAGLAIVKRIIERHGGEIWIDSTLGEGTTFYFTLAPKDGPSA